MAKTTVARRGKLGERPVRKRVIRAATGSARKPSQARDAEQRPTALHDEGSVSV